MKKISTTLLSMIAGLGCVAGQSVEEPVRALLTISGDLNSVWITDATSKVVRYTESEKSTNYKDVRVVNIDNAF
ncbi:MAG: hypothetical protein ACQKBY_06130, partial [Verrucomicrobiales bacterium]